ncbi:MAG: apolipoprotein N-acyltransferase [Phenylobacterium sp.]|uniref:apolipoprotein N-acyltransferase n=1 Tax=Phenylobacterium sp. TaxID=1871053 RepID=UPI00391969A6
MRLASPWLLRLAALCAGLAAALAHPPFGLLPGLLGYGVMMRLVETGGPRPLRSAFLRGWLAGLGYFSLSVWWVAEAFLVDAEVYGWMAPFALVLLAGGLALFWGAAGVAYRALSPGGVTRVLVFAGILAAVEWARGHVFTGFPWNLPGETWRAGSAPSQAASLMGAYGLTWITVAIAAAPAIAFDATPRMRRVIAVAAAAFALVGLVGFGAWRLDRAAPTPPGAARVRVVQADIDQKEKWKPENLDLIFATYEALSQAPAERAPDVVIWPEGALPVVIDDFLAPGSPYVGRIQAMLRPGQTLMLGANRAGLAADGRYDYFNSLIALRNTDPGLQVTAVYDKYRLVPFGEFMPLGELATKIGFRSLVHMPEDFTAGPPPRPISPQGLPPLQPLICYEALFPGFTAHAAERSGVRPRWILNVSNDAWFGATSGPKQHLNLASYRAIEEGLPMVRATPTGVSAVIDAYGRPVADHVLKSGALGVVDADLPAPLSKTTYARFGDAIFAFMLILSGATSVLERLRRARVPENL